MKNPGFDSAGPLCLAPNDPFPNGRRSGSPPKAGAGQSRLSRLENEVLGTEAGLQALEDSLMRSKETRMRRKKKQRLILDVDSTEEPAHGKQ